MVVVPWWNLGSCTPGTLLSQLPLPGQSQISFSYSFGESIFYCRGSRLSLAGSPLKFKMASTPRIRRKESYQPADAVVLLSPQHIPRELHSIGHTDGKDIGGPVCHVEEPCLVLGREGFHVLKKNVLSSRLQCPSFTSRATSLQAPQKST